ncbi:hypothetical protein C8R44DRAFT_20924 [Mycena epipterygia]|nr:hypothetical protein C8R44DRAFT_20924 [Mycena epipterygia]
MATTLRRPLAEPVPAPSRAAQRKQRLLELENEQRLEDAEALKMTEEQRLSLFHSFRSVKFEWSDLDGMRSVRRRYNSPPHRHPSPPRPAHLNLNLHLQHAHAHQPPAFAVLTNAADDAMTVRAHTRFPASPTSYSHSPHSAQAPHPHPPEQMHSPQPQTPAPATAKTRSPVKGLFPSALPTPPCAPAPRPPPCIRPPRRTSPCPRQLRHKLRLRLRHQLRLRRPSSSPSRRSAPPRKKMRTTTTTKMRKMRTRGSTTTTRRRASSTTTGSSTARREKMRMKAPSPPPSRRARGASRTRSRSSSRLRTMMRMHTGMRARGRVRGMEGIPLRRIPLRPCRIARRRRQRRRRGWWRRTAPLRLRRRSRSPPPSTPRTLPHPSTQRTWPSAGSASGSSPLFSFPRSSAGSSFLAFKWGLLPRVRNGRRSKWDMGMGDVNRGHFMKFYDVPFQIVIQAVLLDVIREVD